MSNLVKKLNESEVNKMLRKKKNTKIIKSLNLDYDVVTAIKKLAKRESRSFSNFVNILLSNIVKTQTKEKSKLVLSNLVKKHN